MADDHEPREYASSPCSQHEFDDPPAALTQEVAVLLNALLEGERAGARGVLDMTGVVGDELQSVLDAVARDEAGFCSMLHRHLLRHGYEPSPRVGDFYEKLSKCVAINDKLRLLDHGQTAAVRILDDLLSAINDHALREDLEDMRDTHLRNIKVCATYLDD